VSPKSLTLSISGSDIELDAEIKTGMSVFGRSELDYGTTTYFPFSISEDTIRNATSFRVGSQSFQIDSQTFIVPSLTALSDDKLNTTIATLAFASCGELGIHIAAPFPQVGTLAPKISVKTIAPSALVRKADSVDGYTLCQTSLQLDNLPLGAIVVKGFIGGKVVDSLLVDRGVAGW
jgi:hypothetical protein